MKDTIVQEVREARAAVSADFGHDLGKFFAWAKAHTAAERKAKQPLPTNPAESLKKIGSTKMTSKKRVRPTDAAV